MKKIIAFLISISMLVLTAVNTCAASQSIIEAPEIKFVINGNASSYSDAPIWLNGRILLPANSILADLGVQNDEQHIQISSSGKNAAISAGSTTVVLKAGITMAKVNNTQVKMDVQPALYKGKMYIPVRFIAETLGKKVAWDRYMKTVYIRDEKEFNAVKDILDKSYEAMTAAGSYKIGTKASMGAFMEGMQMLTGNLTGSMEMDRQHNKAHFFYKLTLSNLLMDAGLEDVNMEAYLADNCMYTKTPLFSDGSWDKKTMNEADYLNALDYSVCPEDTLNAGLAVESSENPDETVLKGNIFLSGYYKKQVGSDEIEKMIPIEATAEITINKRTNLISKVCLGVKYKKDDSVDDEIYEDKFEYTYSGYNEAFEVKIPDDLK